MPLAQRAMRPTGGGGGASGAQMALAQFVNDQNAATKKMMTNFQRMQEVQAAEQAQQSQQSAVQLTEAVNQVVRRQKEGELREESHGERQAEREYGEELTVWKKKLLEDSSSLEAQRLERLNQQTTAVGNFVKDWEGKRDKHESLINALEIHADKLRGKENPITGLSYWEEGTAGAERFEQIQKYLNAARSFREDNFRGGYTQAAMRLLNETRSNILAGKPYMDLTNLMVDPDLKELMPIAGMPEPDPEDVMALTDEDLMALEMNGGYIPGGLIGRDPDDPELKKFRDFNVVGLEAAADMIFDEQNMSILRSNQDKDRYQIIRIKEFKKTAEYVQHHREHEMASFKALQARGLPAVMRGMENVMDKLAQDPASFWSGKQLLFRYTMGKEIARGVPTTDVLADTILEETLKSVFGNQSEFFMGLLTGLNTPGEERKVLDTQAEWYTGVELLNGLRIVQQNLNKMAQAPTAEEGGGAPITAQMAKNIVAGGIRGPLANLVGALAPKAEAGKLSGTYTAASEKAVENGLKRMLGEARSKIIGLKAMMVNQPMIKHMRAKAEWVGQYGDALALSWMSDKEADLITPRGLTPEAVAKFEAEVAAEGVPEEGIEAFEHEVELRMTPMAASFQLGMMFSNRADMIPCLAAGGYTDHLPNAGTIMGANLVDLQADFGQQMNEIRAIVRKRYGEAALQTGEQEQEGGKAPADPSGPPAQSQPREPQPSRSEFRGDKSLSPEFEPWRRGVPG